MVLCTSSVCWIVLFNSISMAWARSSSLAGIWAAPRAMAKEACSALFCISARDTSVVLAALSWAAAWSCSERSSSARRPASTIAFLAFSSLFLQEASMLSRSACIWWMSFSSFLLAFPRELLLALTSVTCSLVSISLHLVDVVLQLPFGVSERVVAGADISHLLPRVNQLLLHLPLASDGRLQQSLGLLKLAAHGIDLALSQPVSLKDLVLDLPLLLDGGIEVTKLHVSPLHGLLALRVSLVGMVKRNLHLVDICLVLLFDPESLLLGPGLSLEGGLHGLQSTLVVLPAVLKFFLLLLDA